MNTFEVWSLLRKIDANNFTAMRAFKIFRFGGFLFREFYPYLIKIINKGNELVYPKIMEVFSAIDLSSNKFNGNIPEFVGNFSGFQLRILNLSNNNFTGHILSSLGNLTTLESLELSQNKLSGQIPEQLKQLTYLESFNMSPITNLQGLYHMLNSLIHLMVFRLKKI